MDAEDVAINLFEEHDDSPCNIAFATTYLSHICDGETGASFYRVVLQKHSTYMEIPSTVVGWKSTSRHCPKIGS